MIEIAEEDYTALEGFRLAWRWTDQRWNVLPADALAAILPLRARKAAELYERTRVFKRGGGLLQVLEANYKVVAQIETAGRTAATVTRWLKEQTGGNVEQVVVCWSHELAVVTTYRVFCDYWNDFCYPASDDVAIVPMLEEWHLDWWHEEMFFMGGRRL